MDSQTSILLMLSINPSILVLLNEWEGTTRYILGVQYPNYVQSPVLDSMKPEEYTHWTWDSRTRQFIPTRSDIHNESVESRSRLLVAKHDLLYNLIFNLNIARYPVRTGIDFQETVYLTKKMQAQRFKDNGYDESAILEYPYVLQYADHTGIPLRQAAEDILLKASLDDQLLAKTELLRLKYFNLVKGADDPKKLPNMYQEFIRECFVNARV